MSNGSKFTKPAANFLRTLLQTQNFDVLFDHGDKTLDPNVGNIVVWHGSQYIEPKRPKQLAQLDIAVVAKKTDQVTLLVEIEDSPVSPKTMIGDPLATLLGDGVIFKNLRDLKIGYWTTFVAFFFIDNGSHQNEYYARLDFLRVKIEQIRPNLGTPNSAIGKFSMEGFGNQQELNLNLQKNLNSLLNR